MTWKFGIATDIGGRAEQQDRVDVIRAADGKRSLLVVADGMGGHHGGALAAQAVIDTANNFFDSNSSDPLAALEQLCQQVHQSVISVEREGKQSPGSTVVMLYLDGDEACWAHIGDSRLYHFRNDKVLSRTLDHSMVQLLVTQGEMSEEEMATSPLQNQLYMRLGSEQPPEPELNAGQVQQGDLFLLCSDGFWEYVSPDEVSEALANNELDDATSQLVSLARERGGEGGDNISVAIAQFGKEKKKLGWFF